MMNNSIKAINNEDLNLNVLAEKDLAGNFMGEIKEFLAIDQDESKFSIGEVAEVLEGVSVNPKYFLKDEDLVKGAVNYIRPRHIKYWTLNKGNTFISEEFINKYEEKLLRAGDIVVSKIFDGYNCALIKEEYLPAIASNNVLVIRFNKIDPEVAFNTIAFNEGRTMFLKELMEKAKGYDVKYINKKIIKDIKLPYKF